MNQEAILAEAIQYQQNGNISQAEELCRQLVQSAPNNGEAWYRLGMIAWQTRQYSQARSSLEKCLAVAPNHAQAARSLAGVLAQLGCLDEAVMAFRNALRLHPHDAESHNNLGALLGQLGQVDEATAAIRQAIALKPNYGRAYYNLGVTLEKEGRIEDAAGCYRRAVRCQPVVVEAHYNLALILKSQRQLDSAVANFKDVLRIIPNHVEALTNLGLVYGQQGQFEQAMACFNAAFQHDANHVASHFNRAAVLAGQGRLAEAVKSYKKVLDLNPEHLAATINLAALSLSQDDFETAESYYRAALTIEPARDETYYRLGVVLERQGRHQAAVFNYQRAAGLKPNDILRRLELDTSSPLIMPDEKAIEIQYAYLENVLKNYQPGTICLETKLAELSRYNPYPPFEWTYYGKNNRALKEHYASLFFVEETACRKQRRIEKPYRIGFLVTRGHEKVFNRFVSGLISRLDTAEFEIFVICDKSGVSIIKPEIKNSGVKFVTLADNLEASVEKLRNAAFDLLYFWEVGTDTINYILPFFRLAPVQCTSWGTPETTGIAALDYFVSSELFEPGEAQSHYTETLVTLKTMGLYRRWPHLPRKMKERSHFGWSQEDHLYLCVQNSVKFHPEFDWLLAQILRQDGRGKLLVKAREKHLARLLIQRWQARIPDVLERIQFVPDQSYEDYLNMMAVADVLLDTPHYSGGSTSFEGIAVGTPIVTLPGPYMRSRMTYGCYRKIEVLDSVVQSSEEYVQTAVQLASDRAYQTGVRQKILAANNILFEDTTAVQELGQFFKSAIEKQNYTS